MPQSTILKLSLVSIFVVILFYVFALPLPSFAQCNSTGVLTGGPECEAAGVEQVQQLITRMINISVTVAFIAMTVWLVWSAIKFFITSGGDPKALSQAWSSVTWIFMGVVFMILAYLALRLISAVVGIDVTSYCIGFAPYCLP